MEHGAVTRYFRWLIVAIPLAIILSLARGGEAREAPAATCVVFTHDGSTIFAARSDGLLRVWNAVTGKLVSHFRSRPLGDLRPVISDGRLIYGGDFKTVRVWSLPGLHPVRTLPPSAGYLEALALSLDGETLARAEFFGRGDMVSSVAVMDAVTGVMHRRMKMPDDEVLLGHSNTLAFSPDGKHLAWGGRDSAIRIWITATGESIGNYPFTWDGAAPEGILQIQFSPCGKFLGVARDGACTDLHGKWKIRSEGLLLDFAGDATVHRMSSWTSQAKVSCLAFSPDGTKLALGESGGIIRIMEMKSGGMKRSLGYYGTGIESLAWSLDGMRIVSGDSEGDVTVWDVSSGDGVTLCGDL